jgi:Lon protease-like protein
MNASSGEHVRELPLFPLPLVLFPNMMVPLHIFEERYKELVNTCLDRGARFGIVQITEVVEGTHAVSTARIGCMARIVRVERLAEGRMNIEVVGEERFRILDAHENLPYRTGVVETFRDAPVPAENIQRLTSEVSALLTEFLNLHLRRLGRRSAQFSLPDEPELLSYTASCVLPIEMSGKQTLLEFSDTALRLGAARDILEVEVERLQRDPQTRQSDGSWNPVDDATFTRFHCPN